MESLKEKAEKRETHINLLDDRLKEYAVKIEDLIAYHRLPFKRFETLRSIERQRYLLSIKTTKTLLSRHLPNILGKSEAVDYVLFIDDKWSWSHKFYYDFLGKLVTSKWGEKIRWGGDFKSFYDGPHFELK